LKKKSNREQTTKTFSKIAELTFDFLLAFLLHETVEKVAGSRTKEVKKAFRNGKRKFVSRTAAIFPMITFYSQRDLK